MAALLQQVRPWQQHCCSAMVVACGVLSLWLGLRRLTKIHKGCHGSQLHLNGSLLRHPAQSLACSPCFLGPRLGPAQVCELLRLPVSLVCKPNWSNLAQGHSCRSGWLYNHHDYHILRRTGHAVKTRFPTRCCDPLCALLLQVREGPGLPVAGSCMAVLAQLGRTAGGRAQLRQEGVLHHVLRCGGQGL